MFRKLSTIVLAAALALHALPASAFYYRYQTREARMTQVNTDIGNSGHLRLYPTGGGSTACSGTIIADLTLPASTASNTVATVGSTDAGATTLTFGTITSATATSSNTAICATLTQAGGTVIVNGLTVGLTGGGDGTQNVEMSSNVISSGTTVSVTSAVLTHG